MIRKFYSIYALSKIRNKRVNKEKNIMAHYSFPKLTKKEIDMVMEEWKGVNFNRKHLISHSIYKSIHGFDPKFLTVPLYNPIILRQLNPLPDASVFANKGLSSILFKDLKQPNFFVKQINNHFFNCENELIPFHEAIDILCKQKCFVIKPSINSYGGADIKFIRKGIKPTEAELLIDKYRGNFIAQEIINQHQDTEKFNPQSVNTIRILSLFLNGKVSVLKSVLRCGQNGAEVDNASSGGLMINIKENGKLDEFGIDQRFRKIFETNNGIKIGEQQITGFSKLREMVINNHSKLYPTLRLVAWDFAINTLGDPIFIEGNTTIPGIFWIQLSAGPVFGDLTKEVVEFVVKSKAINSRDTQMHNQQVI